MTERPTRLRGRSGRDRRLAEAFESAAHHPARAIDRLRPSRRSADLAVLTELLAASGTLQALAARFQRPRDPEARVGSALRHVTYAGMPHGAKSFVAAAVARATGERLLWIARDAEIADRVVEELEAWFGDAAAVVTLEPRSALAYERSGLIGDESAARVAALAAWAGGEPRVLVASVQALFQRTLSPDDLPRDPLRLAVGRRVAQDRLLAELVRLGYEAVVEVGGRGEFVRRGGLVDFYPPGAPLPVRAEWFGDEVASLRAFDPADQRGVAGLVDVTILPATEFLMPAAGREAWLRARLGRAARALPDRLGSDLARLVDTGDPGDAAEVWGGVLAPATALDHVGDAIWVLDEPADVDHATETLWAQANERAADLVAAGELSRAWPSVYLEPRVWRAGLHEARTLELHWESDVAGAPPGGNPFGWREPSLPPAPLGRLGVAVARWRHDGLRVVVTSDQSARLAELLEDAGVTAA
ncbi:MAG TPA: hypothetical protein VN771_02265, partial [Candidatus Baltobacteraceae bacterium]|nr:hypothetical protein [Candidatus Baltobacteraceae bacterium]